MFIWSCAIYRFYKTYTHIHTHLPLHQATYNRPAETCINVYHMTDRAYTSQIKSYYAAEQDPSPQEQEN